MCRGWVSKRDCVIYESLYEATHKLLPLRMQGEVGRGWSRRRTSQ
jgi:hypothetical protein